MNPNELAQQFRNQEVLMVCCYLYFTLSKIKNDNNTIWSIELKTCANLS